MRIDSTRLISGTLRLSIFVAFLLVVSFLRYDFVHGAAAQERRVVFVHVGFKFCSDGRTINWGKTGESWINFNDQVVKIAEAGYVVGGSTDTKLAPGTYQVSIHTPYMKSKVKTVRRSAPRRDGYQEELPVIQAGPDGVATVPLNDDFWGDGSSHPHLDIDLSSPGCDDEEDEGEKVSVKFLAQQNIDSPATTPDIPDVRAQYSTKNIGDVKIEVAGQALTTDKNGAAQAEIMSGKYMVKVSVPGDSMNHPLYRLAGAGLIYAGENGQAGPTNISVNSEAGTFEVTLAKHKSKDEQIDNTVLLNLKRIRLVEVRITSQDCKTPDWEGFTLRVDDKSYRRNSALEAYGGSEATVLMDQYEIDPGKHEVGIVAPSYDKAKLLEVEVWRMSPKKKRKAVYQAGEAETVKIKLPASAWDEPGTAPPRMDVYVAGNCNAQLMNDEYRYLFARIVTIQGSVTVTPPNADAEKPAKVGDGVGRGYTIKTAPGSLVVLEAMPGQAVNVGAEYGYIVTIKEATELKMDLVMTRAGQARIKPLLNSGQIHIKRTKSVPATDEQSGHTGASVVTPTANVTDNQTSYTVNYDPASGVTAVGVEEGEVLVTPTNTDFDPVTLAANQRVQVSDKSVSGLTTLSGQAISGPTSVLLYVGIGLAGLVGLLGLLGASYLFYRRLKRPAVQPAFQPSGMNVGARPPLLPRPPAQPKERRCPNPRCGKLAPAGKQFCGVCGTRIAVGVSGPAAASQVERRCPKCNRVVPAGKQFCGVCGTRLT